MHWNNSHQPPAFPASHYQEKACLSLKRVDRGARVLPGGASLPYRTIGLLLEEFSQILGFPQFSKECSGWEESQQEIAEDNIVYDAIVIGARCAGSPTAMLFARQGYWVLLVDRSTFPSDIVSTHSNDALQPQR
jgi:hypothetical protein